MKFKRKYTYSPDLPDKRDHYFTPLEGFQLPGHGSLRSKMSRIEDQGPLGSCVYNAAVALAEYLDRLPDGHYRNYSRLFAYYNGRVIEGTVNEDSGSYIRDGIKAIAQKGLCFETEWPYVISKFKVKPPVAAYRSGAKRKAIEYARVNQSVNDMVAALASGFPIEIGFTVYESFESAAVARTGVVPMPNINTEGILGGHAAVIDAWDLDSRIVGLRNSWGTKWGDKGYFTMPFDYLFDSDFAEDFWIVRKFQNIG